MTPEQTETIAKIMMKFAALGLEAEFHNPISVGPVISAYRFTPRGKTKVSHLEGLSEDLAVTLGAEQVLVKRMPGENAVGFYIPNKERTLVYWRDLISKVSPDAGIPLLLGVDWLGQPFTDDLAAMPHLLIAGSTGSGKSTLLNSLLATVVYSVNSNAVKFILSDTKGVEFGHFVGASHLLFDPATSVYQTMERMEWLIKEVERRQSIFAQCGVRNISEYNSGFVEQLPRIVLVIDELYDCMNEGGKLFTGKLLTIVSKARASGIHCIAATQRPSVKIVTGDIKANFKGRLSFALPSGTDSKTVLDTTGAEHLLMQGDMLFSSPNKSGLLRLHAPWATMDEVRGAISFANHKWSVANAKVGL